MRRSAVLILILIVSGNTGANDITKAGYFFQNMNGICSTSSNGLVFEGQLHAAVYSPIDFSVNENDGIAVIIEH